MSSITSPPTANGVPAPVRMVLPDHTQLPDSDGVPVENFFEHPQSILLTTSLWPILQRLHPDGHFAVGQNSGIYYLPVDPPLKGCRAPDWFYVPDVAPLQEGQYRHSYVMWQEVESPLVLMEFVSGTGREERDRTPHTGKFWIYERWIRASYYVIYEPDRNSIEVHQLVHGRYQQMQPNERGHYVIEPMGIEVGLWHARYLDLVLPWLRAFDRNGVLIPTPEEEVQIEHQRAEAEKSRAEVEKGRADAEKSRAERLAAQLRALGQDPDKV